MSFLKNIAATLAGVALVATASLTAVNSADAQTRWRMASTYGSQLAQLGTLGVQLSEELEKVSDGEFQLRFFEPGALLPALEAFDAIGQGSVDAAWSTPGYWQGKEPALSIFAAIPFGPEAGEYLAWMRHGGGIELMDGIYARHNLKAVICGAIAPEASGWFRQEINSVEDLEGLKMRFFGLGARVMDKLGVSTQLLAAGDIYPALERGTIDATEFSQPAIDQSLGFYQIAKHYYFPGWHQQSTLLELLMNLEKYNALSDQEKAMIDNVCTANILRGFAEGEAIQVEALLEMQNAGVTIHRWPDEILDALESAWLEVAAELSESNEDFAIAWASLSEFRERYTIWKNIGYLD